MAESGSAQVKEQLNKRHLELVEREARLAAKEQVISEQQGKVDKLLASAENLAERSKAPEKKSKRVTVEA